MQKMILKNIFSNSWIILFLEKNNGKCKKDRDIKLVTTDKRGNQLISEPNYHTTRWFSEDLLAIEMKKTKVKMNKPVYLALSILVSKQCKTILYGYWQL